MTPSPFLNSSPKDLAYALGETSRNIEFGRGGWYQIELLQNGAIVYSSSRIPVERLGAFYDEVRLYRRAKDKIRARIRVTEYNRGYPYQATFRLNTLKSRPLSNGQTKFIVQGSVVQSSPAGRKARQWPSKLGKSFGGAKIAVTRASTLRPSPEILTRPFLSTNEFGMPGNVTTLQNIESTTTYYRSWTGTRTPGFGKKRKTALPDNNHSVVLAFVGENRWSWYQLRPANGAFGVEIRPFTSILAVPSVPYLHVGEAEDMALKRLIQKSQTGIQANLALNIAQVSQLSSLITTNVGRMTTALSQLRRGNLVGAVKTFGTKPDPRWKGSVGRPSVKKSVADNWLQLQYGWKPLLSDIEGFLKVMSGQQGAGDFIQSARASGTVSRESTVAQPNTSNIHGSNHGKTIFRHKTTVKYVVRWRMDNPLLALFSQTGFTNPINLFWETIPFSFVADWFLPIGSYLEGLSAWQGATFLGGCKVRFTRMSTDSTVAYSGPHQADPLVNVLNFANYRDEQIFLDRAALTSFPTPRMPTIRNGISEGNRAANAIALLVKGLR